MGKHAGDCRRQHYGFYPLRRLFTQLGDQRFSLRNSPLRADSWCQPGRTGKGGCLVVGAFWHDQRKLGGQYLDDGCDHHSNDEKVRIPGGFCRGSGMLRLCRRDPDAADHGFSGLYYGGSFWEYPISRWPRRRCCRLFFILRLFLLSSMSGPASWDSSACQGQPCARLRTVLREGMLHLVPVLYLIVRMGDGGRIHPGSVWNQFSSRFSSAGFRVDTRNEHQQHCQFPGRGCPTGNDDRDHHGRLRW